MQINKLTDEELVDHGIRLKEEIYRRMRKHFSAGERKSDIAKKFGYSVRQVYNIVVYK